MYSHFGQILAAASPALAIFAAFTLLVGCEPDIQEISAQSLADHLAAEKAETVFNLVDLRDDEAYWDGRLPQALNVPYERLATDRMLFVDGRPVIFYDEAEPDVERLRAALGDRAPDNIVVLSGGIREWLSAGLPVVQDAP